MLKSPPIWLRHKQAPRKDEHYGLQLATKHSDLTTSFKDQALYEARDVRL